MFDNTLMISLRRRVRCPKKKVENELSLENGIRGDPFGENRETEWHSNDAVMSDGFVFQKAVLYIPSNERR